MPKAKVKKAVSKKAVSKKPTKNDWKVTNEYKNDKGYISLEGISPAGRIVYPAIDQAKLSYAGRQNENRGIEPTPDDYYYQVTLIIPNEDPMLKSMKELVKQALKESFGLKKDSEMSSYHFPLGDGNVRFRDDKENNAHYKNTTYLNLKIKQTNEQGLMILGLDNKQSTTIKSDFYDGCWCRANVKFAPYANGSNKGMTIYWDMIRKVADDDKIARKKSIRKAKSFDSVDSNVTIGKNGMAVYG
jgi:hypothetical protein